MLPVSILKEIDRMMMGFLWFGHGHRMCVFISWKDVCRLKEERGLSIWRPLDYNSGMLRLLWEVETNKSALWVKWIRRKYVCSGSIWCTRPPQSASWAWRSILRVRHLASELLDYNLGDGSSTLFFLDPWLNHQPLHLHVGDYL